MFHLVKTIFIISNHYRKIINYYSYTYFLLSYGHAHKHMVLPIPVLGVEFNKPLQIRLEIQSITAQRPRRARQQRGGSPFTVTYYFGNEFTIASCPQAISGELSGNLYLYLDLQNEYAFFYSRATFDSVLSLLTYLKCERIYTSTLHTKQSPPVCRSD